MTFYPHVKIFYNKSIISPIHTNSGLIFDKTYKKVSNILIFLSILKTLKINLHILKIFCKKFTTRIYAFLINRNPQQY
ncbi:hypothetical protein ECH_0288 [Ehrlichia chaffeensis str. Arkansas]|uniref:Uncharacterized protein n=1 Tax=Ehrlichia chaffeensis (strain ATCC CRL-10679 / Arkansas) TaxID=205920 RepID=Q2GHH4_EHRCR|nr:hypothetical protein ECH_0288 [Ehrlichia chaffeensis str. Arkansas]